MTIEVNDNAQPNVETDAVVARIDEERDGERDIVMRKLSNDTFVRTGKQIIDACEMQIGFEAWQQNIADLWEQMIKVARDKREKVTSLYMLPRHGTVHVLFATRHDEFDFDLADELACWNIRFRRSRGMYGEIEAAQIPESELLQFVEREHVGEALTAIDQPRT